MTIPSLVFGNWVGFRVSRFVTDEGGNIIQLWINRTFTYKREDTNELADTKSDEIDVWPILSPTEQGQIAQLYLGIIEKAKIL